MKRTVVDEALYARLVEAYRHEPGNKTHAARVAEVDRRTATKAWLEGWPKLGFDPIQKTIEDEQKAARALLIEKRADQDAEQKLAREREVQATEIAAKNDAIASRSEEAQTVRAARHNAMGLLAVTAQILRGANKLAKHVEAEIEHMELKPQQAIALFQSIASTARQANETAKIAISMERTLLGEPDKIIGVEITMNEREALREIDLAQRAAVRHREVVEVGPETTALVRNPEI